MKDPTAFKKRFAAYKLGKLPYLAGRPIDDDEEEFLSTYDFIKKFEGDRDTVYLDSKGIKTVGMGFTDKELIKAVEARRVGNKPGKITDEERLRYYNKHITEAEDSVRSKVPLYDKMSPEAHTALLSYYYNYPAGYKGGYLTNESYVKRPTRFIEALHNRDYKTAAKEMDAGMNDKNSPGLRNRRLEELKYFLHDGSPIPSQRPITITLDKRKKAFDKLVGNTVEYTRRLVLDADEAIAKKSQLKPPFIKKYANGKSPYDDDNMRTTTLPEVEIVGEKPIRTVLNVELTNSFALPSFSDMIAPIPLLQYMQNFIRLYLHIPRLKAPYEFIEKLSIPKYDDGKEPEEEYAIGTTMLPEVVVKPNMDLETNKMIESFFPDIFPEQDYDYSYYTRLQSRRKLNRFMEIYNEAGRPSIRSLSNYPHPDETKRYMSDGKTYRAYYRPDINTIYANNIYDVIAELAHPIQDKYGNNSDWKEYYKPKDNFGNWLRSVFGMDPKLFERTNYNADIDPRGGSRYQYPDRFEGETHYDFEPLLRSYLTDETIPNSINAGIGDYIYPQNGLYEVVDSAKSYNTQRLNLRKRYYVRPNQKELSETY